MRVVDSVLPTFFPVDDGEELAEVRREAEEFVKSKAPLEISRTLAKLRYPRHGIQE